MNKEINEALKLFKENGYKRINENMIEVGENIVSMQIKKGRRYLTCSCENQGRFGNLTLCRHKFLFMYLPFLERMDERITQLLGYYSVAESQYKTDEGKQICGFFLADLEELRRLRL